MAHELRKNPFTQAGFVDLDAVVANALKRGRNAQGYEVGFDFSGGTEARFQATLSPDQVTEIREIVGLPVEAAECVKGIALVINDARDSAVRGYSS